MMKSNIIIAVSVGLLLGVLLGFFGAGILAKKRIEKVRRASKDGRVEHERIVRMLDLTEDQQKKIRPILEQELPRQRAEIKQHRVKLDSLRNAMFKQIEPELNGEQRDKLQKIRMRPRRPHRRR